MTPSERDYAGVYRGVRAAVLGATGFIGRWVALALHDAGADVHAVVRDAARAERVAEQLCFRSQIHVCDLTDLALTTNTLREIAPAIVFNLAGYGVDPAERDESTAVRMNAEIIAVLFAAVAPNERWAGQTIVHVGSALEYGAAAGDLNERTTPDPTTLYGRTKVAGTRALTSLCRERKLRALTARLFTVYGAGEHANRLLPTLIQATARKDVIPLTEGRQQRDFTYVEDVAEGLLRLGVARAEPGDVVNLATGKLMTVRAFTETAATILGIAPERLHFGALPTRSEEMTHDPVAITRLQTLTGWSPQTSVDEGIRRTLGY